MISREEKEILRGLALKQKAYAESEKNKERVRLWYLHNSCRGERPMVHVEIDTFEQELLPQRMKCTDPTARRLERDLYRNFLNVELFDDDWVVPPYFPVSWETWFIPFGHKIERTFAQDSSGNALGHQFQYLIGDLQEDWGQIQPSSFGVDREKTKAYAAAAEETFGDILPVKMVMNGLYAVPTQDVVHLMGMEAMCYAMYDYPELFLEMMDKLAEDYLSYFRFLKEEGLLMPTAGYEMVGQGSRCFTEDLPQDKAEKISDVWGFMDSQETVSISPSMFGQYVFPCYKKIGETFGLLSYGCCEPVDPVWDYISQFKNLRKVSCSPWCNEDFMGERLRGSKTIFHRKPSPNFLGVDEQLDEEIFRKYIGRTMKAACGCTLEVTQRDVYTIHHNEEKVRRYVQIIREEAENHWKP